MKESFTTGFARPPERNVQEWLEIYQRSPRLAVVDRIAQDLSFCEGKLFRMSGNDEKEVTAHPFLDFWKNPNPMHEYGKEPLWQLFQTTLLLKGEGFFVVERSLSGRPQELWPIPVHWVYGTPYMGHPFYMCRTPDGAILNVHVENMFSIKRLNPLDPTLRGIGQAEAIADEIETDEYAAKFQKRFFFNDATPNLLISMPGSTDEQRQRFRAEWMDKFKGVFKTRGVATVDGAVTVQNIGSGMNDLDMVNGRQALHEACRRHFGVPPEIMGETGSSNRATSWNAQVIYNQNVLTPMLKAREKAINQQLLPAFGDDLVWRFDELVARNEEYEQGKALSCYGAGLITKNEARTLLGFGTIEGGDEYAGAPAASETPNEPTTEEEARKKKLPIHGEAPSDGEERVKEYLAKAYRNGAARARKAHGLTDNVPKPTLSDGELTKIARANMREFKTEARRLQTKASRGTNYGISLTDDPLYGEILAQLDAQIAQMEEDDGEALFEEALSDMTALARNRANSWAACMAAQGEYDQMAEAGYTHKTWKHNDTGPHSRKMHKAMHGKTIAMDEYFVMPDGAKLLYPKDADVGDKTAYGTHCMNCKCTCDYELREATLSEEEVVAKPTRRIEPEEVTTEKPTLPEQDEPAQKPAEEIPAAQTDTTPWNKFESMTQEARVAAMEPYKVTSASKYIRDVFKEYQRSPAVNILLRGGEYTPGYEKIQRQMAEQQKEPLEAYMSKRTIDEPIVVHRNYGFMRYGDTVGVTRKFDSLNVGDIFHDAGYSSTTLLENLGTLNGTQIGYRFKIYVPAGTHGVCLIGNLPLKDKQQEVLLDRDMEFRILEIDHADKTGTMEVIPKVDFASKLE
jgi:HK97 family phage portal protein